MREKIWRELINIKFKVYYIELIIEKYQKKDRYISIFLSVISLSSVSAWTLWEWGAMQYVWAALIAISNILVAVRPFFPYSKYAKNLIEKYPKIQDIQLAYEKLWYQVENDLIEEKHLAEQYFQLRKEQNDVFCPTEGIVYSEDKRVIREAEKKIEIYLKENFGVQAGS